ncbi:hypothetical protein ASPZODRAFT_128882 [Penicilliopsis zonata CBS 506.65]|uniref:2,5-diamino-6-ribosylamino-4(3H)-pyrimidinone 5'-phosphate reductase n=1 Tax=Penicilliopsis zonata CBS 506.65 TaxID=1073090 RepID=A0A1L9SSQ0_9EURO|nr:hypothetical protein ASPZODRAFT_128882 [Penicilliopsis zonata CBS 506.65]OJJ50252.1 hypothetical protein ASPZODRAFT_128882 [Penicilliopsis zonata CBS 506.65]
MAPRDALEFPASDRVFLEPHLPPLDSSATPATPSTTTPFTTLTFATSLDSALALSPGTRTVLSGAQSKAMTHYLRSRHDGILIGVGTAVADDPGLNCRILGVSGYESELESESQSLSQELHGQPRPVVIDPNARWGFSEESKLFQLCREGKGRAPWIVVTQATAQSIPFDKTRLLERYGGRFITVSSSSSDSLDWRAILETLKMNGLSSVMIEGGGQVINSLLEPPNLGLIDSVIVTIAPTWLGRGGVVVSPARRVDEGGNAIPAARLRDVVWYPLGEDVVLCGRIGGVHCRG